MKMKRFIIFLALLAILISFINREVVYLPLLKINAPQSISSDIKTELDKVSFMGFTFVWKIRNINLRVSVPHSNNLSVVKRGFLKWEISSEQEVCNYLIKLNGYPMSINEEWFLIDESEKTAMEIDKNSLIIFTVNVKAKSDARVIYNDYIRPFLVYVNSVKSKLCPVISEINFDDSFGLSFISYDKKTIILDKRRDFEVIERDIFKVKNLLIEKNRYTNYDEFDFRFSNRVVCRRKE